MRKHQAVVRLFGCVHCVLRFQPHGVVCIHTGCIYWQNVRDKNDVKAPHAHCTQTTGPRAHISPSCRALLLRRGYLCELPYYQYSANKVLLLDSLLYDRFSVTAFHKLTLDTNFVEANCFVAFPFRIINPRDSVSTWYLSLLLLYRPGLYREGGGKSLVSTRYLQRFLACL